MKKKTILAFAMFFVIIFQTLFIAGCSGNSDSSSNAESKDDGIELTLANYSKYLTVSGKCTQNAQRAKDTTGLLCTVITEGASTNYDYIDVKVTVKFTAEVNYFTYRYDPVSWSDSVTAECNISGDCTYTQEIQKPKSADIMQLVSDNASMTVVDVSGTVRKA